MAHSDEFRTFDELRARLDEIVDEVNAEGVSLDDALALYEEAVKLGLSACDLSERDIDLALCAEDDAQEPASGLEPVEQG